MSEINETPLSGQELKELMIYGELPEEYITEANINVLLQHELVEMGNDENYDMSVINYCVKILSTNYRDSAYENRKQRVHDNIKKKTKHLYQTRQKSEKKAAPLYIPKRIGAIACIVLAVLVSSHSFIAYAFGINLFEVVLKWGEEQLSITIKNDNHTSDEIPNENLYIEFQSFDEFIKSSPDLVLPKYLPDGFDFDSADKLVNDTYIDYMISFYNESLKKILTILIKQISNRSMENEYKIEIDNEYNEVYMYNEIPHYITSNYENYSAVWSYKNCVYNIFTSISLDEIKLIINSFYKGND